MDHLISYAESRFYLYVQLSPEINFKLTANYSEKK